MKVGTVLDAVQKKLHDGGKIWTRAELLRSLNDGYLNLLAESKAVRRMWIEDVPGRFAFTHTHEWEDHCATGPHWRWSVSCATGVAATSYWEAEFVAGVTPTKSRAGVTQLWERALLSQDIEASFRFALPKDHDYIKRVTWNDKALTVVAVKQFDELRTAWMREGGEPIVWNAGTGRNRTFELYEVRTDYQQGWALRDVMAGGVPRQFSGSHTYGQSINDPVNNGFAYSSPADMQTLVGGSYDFAPTSAFSSDGDVTDAPGDRPSRFTMRAATDSGDNPSAGFFVTQPWEINNRGSGRMLGMFPWELAHSAMMPQQPDTKPKLPGPGRRFTTDGTTQFYTQAWESDLGTATGAIRGTHAWESFHGAAAIAMPFGTIRGVSSPDRQYLPVPLCPSGRVRGAPRDWKSSDSAVTVTQVFLPSREMDEFDEFELIPDPLVKYVRYFALARAFGRQGEGHNSMLADHYDRRFKMGVRFFKRLADVAHKDRVWAREDYEPERRRPERVRLPSQFPLIEW